MASWLKDISLTQPYTHSLHALTIKSLPPTSIIQQSLFQYQLQVMRLHLQADTTKNFFSDLWWITEENFCHRQTDDRQPNKTVSWTIWQTITICEHWFKTSCTQLYVWFPFSKKKKKKKEKGKRHSTYKNYVSVEIQ